jgi:hypothetical protein
MDLHENVEKIEGGKTNIIMDSQILTALMTCPRLADFRFNHRLQPVGGKSNSLEVGSIAHKFLEVFYKSHIAGLDRDKSIAFGFAGAELYIRGCKECSGFVPSHCLENESREDHICNDQCILKPRCGHPANEYPGVQNTPKDSAGNFIGWQYALDTMDQYMKFWVNDSWVPLEVEVVKGKILYEDDEIRILWKAKLDLVTDTNQGIYPMDHKTMKQRRDTNSMNNQFMGQCIIQESRSVIINKIGWQTSLKPEEKFVRAFVPYTPQRLMEWQSEILPYYAKLMMMYTESGYFPPNFASCEGKYGNCNFYKPVCGDNPEMREENLKLNFIVGPEWNPTNEED